MSRIKVKGGFKIKLESGKLLPKIYSTKKAVDDRLKHLKRFRSKK